MGLLIDKGALMTTEKLEDRQKEKALQNIKKSNDIVRLSKLWFKYLYDHVSSIHELRVHIKRIVMEGAIEDGEKEETLEALDYYVTDNDMVFDAWHLYEDSNMIDRLTLVELSYWARVN